MFRSAHEIRGYKVDAVDGECGKVKDLLFDDQSKIIRYVVVDTGGWLVGRQVLISPVAVSQIGFDTGTLSTVLSKASVEQSPSLETDCPVSRQHERELTSYYNWPVYWGFMAPAPVAIQPGYQVASENAEPREGNPHLRSVAEIKGYHIQCMEGEVGHVEDLIIDTETWVIRYLVIDMRNWLPGKKVMVSFDWVTHITWEDQKAHLDLTQSQLVNAPGYDPKMPINREQETHLYDFYGRKTYW